MRVNKELYAANMADDARVIINQGGTSSGKTYCIMQCLFQLAGQKPNQIITVVGQDLPNLKAGALRDARMIRGSETAFMQFFRINESSSQIIGRNDSVIEFKSYQNEQDARSGKRDYLFVNEANGVPYPIYQQLEMRTRKRVYIDYNPSERFWVHDHVIGKKGAKLIISDHRHNAFLTDEEHERIESISDPEMWKVYARGKTGKLEGLIFPDYKMTEAMPDKDAWRLSAFGLDWGFTNDPTALIHVVLAHGELWLEELIYETGMTNQMISSRFRMLGLSHGDVVVADCAEPKSIAELRHEGWKVTASVKGRDSINVGIDIMRRYRINLVRPAMGMAREFASYKWKTDKSGNHINEPVDAFNHAIDAVRYVCMAYLSTRRKGAARAHLLEI